MSHFSSLNTKFANLKTLVEALMSMGVPAGEIKVLESLKGQLPKLVQGQVQTMAKAQKTYSSRWGSRSGQPCEVIVTEAGMKELAKAAGAHVDAYELGVFELQRAELGFYDCQCTENPGYIPTYDGYEAGHLLPGYLMAMYQIEVLKDNPHVEVSQLARNENGEFVLRTRQRKQEGRHTGTRSRVAAMLGGSRRR